MKTWLIRAMLALPLAVMLVAAGGAASAVSRLPELQPWHRLVSDLEPRAAEITASFSLAEYLAREQAVFQEAHDKVERVVSASANPEVPSRYTEGSRSDPAKLDARWNRTSILNLPFPSGGALLIHGLTDSPYSMRAVAERLHALGYYTVSLRMQGHGTVPGGLVNTGWEDWSAAVRMGARHVRQRIGPDLPFVMVGYSNGGALITKYTLDALYDSTLPPPSKLILISPMIGVSPAAGLAGAISLLGPVVPKARWIDVVPEYNPFKYNSFPANAGRQTARLTRALSQELAAAAADGRIAGMPPVLAFQSLVDTTVSTAAVAYELLDRLPAGRNELVLFDMNRQSRVDAFTRGDAVLPRLIGDGSRPYAVTLITNTSPDTLDVSAKTVAAGSLAIVDEPLGLAWPDAPNAMYSLSHVALPFPADDPIYGGDGNGREVGSISLGRLSPRGEKGTLIIPAEVLMRVTWNPFFPYLAQRIEGWESPSLAGPDESAIIGAAMNTPLGHAGVKAPPLVFVVDDDAAVRVGLERLLRSAGYQAHTYPSAAAFLDAAPSGVDACLILDIKMPGLNGLELQEALASRDWVIPIVFLTSTGDIPATVRAMKHGAVDFLTKPVEESVLFGAIEMALARATADHRQNEEVTVLRTRFDTLTPREKEVMQLVVVGMLNKQIAGELGAAEKTIKVHRARVMQKMQVQSVAELVRAADRLNLN